MCPPVSVNVFTSSNHFLGTLPAHAGYFTIPFKSFLSTASILTRNFRLPWGCGVRGVRMPQPKNVSARLFAHNFSSA
jgi:hypothetical protein